MPIKFSILTILALLPWLAHAEHKTPNILFAIADDWGMHAGAYGTEWVKTPSFDRVAKDGLLFNRVYTPNAKCAPSRACILTGRNPWQLEAAANHWCYFPSNFKTWCEALSDHDWHVGHTNKGWAPGIALDANNKQRQLTGKAWNQNRAKPPTSAISNNDYAANFDAFLDASPTDKPWAFWFGAGEPHRKYEFGSSRQLGKSTRDIDRVPNYWPDNETVRTDMLDYAVEVEHFDAHLGRMIKSLEKRDLLKNTLIIVTSDHGMPFPRCKGAAYRDSNQVPLAMMWPSGIPQPGRTIDGYVSLIDIAPTVMKVAGIAWKESGMQPTPGFSLTHWFEIPTAPPTGVWAREHILIGKERHDIGRPNDWGYPIRGVIWKDLLYIKNYEPTRWPHGNPETGYLNTDGGATKTEVIEAQRKNPKNRHWELCFGKRSEIEIYDLSNDSDCTTNLAGNHPQADNLKHILEDQLKAEGDPRINNNGKVFDEYLYADKQRRDFYNRFMNGENIPTNWVNPGDFETPLESP